MSLDVQGTFVSEKINKIRWIPEDYVDTKCFFTGSWDNEENNIKVWTFESPVDGEDAEYPRSISNYRLEGDVTEIRFIDQTRVAVSSSKGDVRLLEISVYDKQTPLKESKVWTGLHNFGREASSCTALATLDGEVTTVGEDGRINVLNTRRGELTRTIEQADSCAIHCVNYIKHNEVITGNLRGHMKIWDLRQSVDKPAASFLLSEDQYAATCIVHHPTQHHMILAGSEGGSLAVWDLRINNFPASLLHAHKAAVTEMQFHPENPQKLLSCSAGGEIWDWNMDMLAKSSKDSQSLSAWSPLDDKSCMMVASIMPNLHKSINTLDCNKSRVLCGADNEAVYLVKNFHY